jgi:BirA family biotin operon repressor/biotin-[acetyl-CoA-carboxylase] ligase
VALLLQLDGWCDRLSSSAGRATLVDVYRRACATIGSLVRVELAGGSFEGRALDITDQGHLLVERRDTGTIDEVTTGDVVHVRPV